MTPMSCVHVSKLGACWSYLRRIHFHLQLNNLKRSNSYLLFSPVLNKVSKNNSAVHVFYRNYTTCKMPEKKVFERLPKLVIPEIYHIHIKPDLETFKFDGTEIIKVKILEPTNKIVINCIELKINSVSLKLQTSGLTLVPKYSLSEEDETVTFSFDSELPLDKGELSVNFSGELNSKLKGFYRGKSTCAEDKEIQYYAATQFESTDARRCFPCWDEPAVKAQFDITLSLDNRIKVAISNMPVLEESDNDGIKTVKFQRTPIMSTYLVAFVVGNFDYVEDKSRDGILVRVYTPVGRKEQGLHALAVATKVLPYYKEYFNIAYPLPKMDLIALADIAPAAMENWGLVTYREACLLVDKSNTSAITKQHVALVVGHELAHQWFGNLVTMEWWTHLWLNEGYASFVEYLCVAYLFPEYDIWTQFVTDTYCSGLQLDALKNSHPIEVPVGHPEEVDEIFDDISYNKGASVIRMLHKYIGDADFRKGMHLYLTRHQYKNTYTEDLWAALEEASNKPVRAVMSTWTKQMGFPVITVESSVQENNNVRTVTISQSKFSIGTQDKEDETLWLVPISFSSSKMPDKEFYNTMLDTRSTKISLPNVEPDEWVKLNPGTVGFYRTKYPPHLLQQFTTPIKERILPPLDRLGLLDDLFALVLAGHSSTVDVLKLMSVMTEEDNYTVWRSMLSCFSKLYSLLLNTDFIDKFLNYGLQLIAPISKKLGCEPKSSEGHLDTLLRSLVLTTLVKCEDKQFLVLARQKFDDHCSGKNIIPADLRGSIYRAALAEGGKDVYDTLIKIFGETDLQEEKDRITKSFAAINREDLIKEALNFLILDKVDAHNAITGIVSCSVSKIGHEITWKFVKENWDFIFNKYQSGFLLNQVLKHTTDSFATLEKASEIESFFEGRNVDGLDRTLQQSLETIRNNAMWLQKDKDDIYTFLQKQY